MRILGVDPSSTAIGWAVVDCNDGGYTLVDSNSKSLEGAKVAGNGRKRPMSPNEKFVEFREWFFAEVEAVVQESKPDATVVERPQTSHPTPAMMETVGMVRAALCGQYDWTVLPPMHPKTARKLMGVGGNASKIEAAEYAGLLLGDSAAGLDEHAMDAAVVAIAGYVWIQEAEAA